MFKYLKASVVAAAAISSGFAAAETFNFTNLTPQSGITGCGFNSGSDICGASLTFAQGSLSATATGTYFGSSTFQNVGVRVVQDFNGTNPTYVGLGVYHKVGDTADDNVTSGEVLTLTFNQMVTLTGLNFRAEGHGTNFGSLPDTFLLNNNSRVLTSTISNLSITGTSFSFGYGGTSPDQFYLSGMTVTAVPEPESLAMMLAGLGLMGGVARRRLRNQSA